MSLFDKLSGRLTAPKLTRGRIVLALLVAVGADALQIPLAALPATEIIDVIAMLLTMWLVGFHLLLLPTFVIEFIPVAGMLPTWTACVGTVIALRKREQSVKPVIDVDATTSSVPPSQILPPRATPPPAPPPARD